MVEGSREAVELNANSRVKPAHKTVGQIRKADTVEWHETAAAGLNLFSLLFSLWPHFEMQSAEIIDLVGFY
jgi:hypothetical protein